MATVTYGSSALPSDVLTAREATSTAVSIAFDASVALVGGYDANNADTSQWTVNEPIEVNGEAEAADFFGSGSELHRATQLAFLNGAGRVVCVPVDETSVTESFASTASFTINNNSGDEGIIDPRTNTEHEITATDTVDSTSMTVNLVDGTPTTPSDADTLNLNPVTGEAEADSSSDYDVTYDEGSYLTALDNVDDEDVRFVVSLTEHVEAADRLQSNLNTRADSFDFKRGIAGVPPSTDPSNYSVPYDDQRIVLVAPSRMDAFDERVRSMSVVGGQFAGTDLGDSATGNALESVDSLKTNYTVSEITSFGDGTDLSQVTVLRKSAVGNEIVEDLTTSTGSKFGDVYRCEIIDDVAYSLHLVSKEFISEPNTVDSRSNQLESPMRSVLRSASNTSPPLLSSIDGSRPFTVSTSADENDDERVTAAVGIDVTGVAKTVEIDLAIGSVVQLGGIE